MKRHNNLDLQKLGSCFCNISNIFQPSNSQVPSQDEDAHAIAQQEVDVAHGDAGGDER